MVTRDLLRECDEHLRCDDGFPALRGLRGAAGRRGLRWAAPRLRPRGRSALCRCGRTRRLTAPVALLATKEGGWQLIEVGWMGEVLLDRLCGEFLPQTGRQARSDTADDPPGCVRVPRAVDHSTLDSQVRRVASRLACERKSLLVSAGVVCGGCLIRVPLPRRTRFSRRSQRPRRPCLMIRLGPLPRSIFRSRRAGMIAWRSMRMCGG